MIKELCKLAGIKNTRTTPYHSMGNGMTVRFNNTLCNMLGTLDEYKKMTGKHTLHQWYMRTMQHVTNICDTEITGYVGKLKERLEFAYKTASAEAAKQAVNHEVLYDFKVRQSKLEVGDRVLVKNVRLDKKQKLADRWLRDVYVVDSQPNSDIPVYLLDLKGAAPQKFSLPFHSFPAIDDIRHFEDECERHGTRRRGKPEELDNSEGSDVTDDSEDDELYVVTQESDRQVNMPSQHPLNADASEYIPTGNREQELVSEGHQSSSNSR